MPGSVYTHSHFEPDEFGNGGCKRTAQIREILVKNNIVFNIADFELHQPKPKRLSSYIKGLMHNKKLTANARNDLNTGKILKSFEHFVKKEKPAQFILESVTSHHLMLTKVLHANKIPFIALPHNIESLVAGNASFKSGVSAPHWFAEELKYLNYSNKVFTISSEEQWLLSLYGIDADYLPYYPTDKVQAYLLGIRKAREKREDSRLPKKLLLLGTFYNRPTMQGYLELLKHISKFKNIELNIVGFGSERLENLSSPNIKVWGSVSTEVLKEIIVANDAVILHQGPTTGALTKIPELLIAGIPIIANHTASRSFYGTEGVHTYFNYPELLELLQKSDLKTPPVPRAPTLAERRFIDTIHKLNV
ncbi:MAG: glycosyltransferase [Mucilaginibacter sp.]|nr:glycosyltransferase [Mucilaginibacter sp.]